MIENYLIKKNTEVLEEKLIFKNEVKGAHSGQIDVTLFAYENGEMVGYVDYSIYKGSPHIDLIEVKKEYRGRGIGKDLILELTKTYDYDTIEWGMMTDDGYKLQQSLDKYFKVDRNKLEQKHIDASILKDIKRKNSILGEFANNLYTLGLEKSWDKLLQKYEEYVKDSHNYNTIQDVQDILEWVEGSKTNENPPSYEPPYYVFETIKKLGIKGYEVN